MATYCRINLTLAAALAMAASSPAWAEGDTASAPVAQQSSMVSTASSWWDGLRDTARTTWRSEQYELYVPLHTWHNRSAYTREKIDSYNENPWGLGAGKYRFDDNGNWHAWYAMVFADSHHKMEPIAGYGYQKIWRPGGDWRLGLGFTAGVTARQDYSYAPIPVILPLVSIEYGRVALQSTYVPGGKGNGNVLFTWLRWQF